MQVGRRSLLLSGSILGLLADFIVAVVFAVTYTGGANLPESASVASIVLVSDHISTPILLCQVQMTVFDLQAKLLM